MEKQATQAIIDHQLIRMLRRQLDEGEEVVITVNGRSMLPLLKPNDTILLEPVQPHQLMRGDIITIDCDGTLLTHRFWGYLNHAEQLLTRGDRQVTFDTPHTCEQLVGRIRMRQRGNLHLQQGIGHWLNDYLKWVFTVTHKFELLLKKEPDRPQTIPLNRLLGRLLQYLAYGAASLMTRIVDLWLT